MITEKTKIEDCDLSIHIKRIFKNAKIETIEQVLKYDINYLIRFRGFGKRSVKEIVHFVNINGFFFNN